MCLEMARINAGARENVKGAMKEWHLYAAFTDT